MSLADDVIRFAENLTLVGSRSGEPLKLLPFQKKILRGLYKTDTKGNRVINRACLFIPRKCAKTYLTSLCVLFEILARGKGRQVLSIASTWQQAGLIFEMCSQILLADKKLKSMVDAGIININKSIKRISCTSNFSFYQAHSSEKSGRLGFSPSICVIDEAQSVSDPEVISTLTTGMAAHKDFLTLFVGTAGSDKNSIFYAEYSYAKKILQKKEINPHYAAFIFEASEGDDIWSEATWKKAMPAYGHFLNPEVIKQEFALAKRLPHKQHEAEQYYLNRWSSDNSRTWIREVDWNKNSSQPLGDAEWWTMGIDIGSISDLTCFCLFGQNSKGLFDVLPFYFCNEAAVERRQSAEFDYKKWSESYLTITPGNATDQEYIWFNHLVPLFQQYDVRKVLTDDWGMQWLGPKLLNHGVDVQSYSQKAMSEPLKKLEQSILQGKLAHGGHPVLAWNVANCRLKTDKFDNYSVTKEMDSKKIDGVVALALAAQAWESEQDTTSVYDSPDGVIWISSGQSF